MSVMCVCLVAHKETLDKCARKMCPFRVVITFGTYYEPKLVVNVSQLVSTLRLLGRRLWDRLIKTEQTPPNQRESKVIPVRVRVVRGRDGYLCPART